KLKSGWWSGQELRAILHAHKYFAAPFARDLKPWMYRWLARATIVFECTFPLALFDRRVCAVYLVLGFFFHLANAAVLGLNRFLHIWLAAYPAVYGIHLAL